MVHNSNNNNNNNNYNYYFCYWKWTWLVSVENVWIVINVMDKSIEEPAQARPGQRIAVEIRYLKKEQKFTIHACIR